MCSFKVDLALSRSLYSQLSNLEFKLGTYIIAIFLGPYPLEAIDL
jgi:hypothetical protein